MLDEASNQAIDAVNRVRPVRGSGDGAGAEALLYNLQHCQPPGGPNRIRFSVSASLRKGVPDGIEKGEPDVVPA